ncbi:hypothetical protein [Haladaptatus sp. NG-SE-30]
MTDDPDETEDRTVADERDTATDRAVSDSDATTGRAEPLADLAAEVETRRSYEKESIDDSFVEVEVDVDDIDADDLWDDLLAEDSGELVVTAPREESEDDRDVRTIPKSTCHGCPHFGEPPTLHCTHDGTDILALDDMEHFRVADFPMVVDEVDPLDE